MFCDKGGLYYEEKSKTSVRVVVACVMIFAMQSTAFASAAGDDEGVMPLTEYIATANLTANSANAQRLFTMNPVLNEELRYTISFDSTRGPISVRLYVYKITGSGASDYTKVLEQTLVVGEEVNVSFDVNTGMFCTVMFASGTSGQVTFKLWAH